MTYLDNSATTYPKPECVYKALDFANRNLAFNSGRGLYKESKMASEILDKARMSVASLVNTEANNVVFLSSATEALNIIINGLDFADGDNVYLSPFEHNAIVRPLYNILKNTNINIRIIPFDKETWQLNEEKLKNLFALYPPKAVFISQISNVTGFALPYKDIFVLSKRYPCINVLDSAQSFGVFNPSINNIDYIVFAGHKSLYASFGIAGFINLNGGVLKITKSGGTGSDSLNHEMPKGGFERYESGSENVVAAYGLIESIKWLKQTNVYDIEEDLVKYLLRQLELLKNVRIYLPRNVNIMGIVSFNVDGYKPQDVGTILGNEFDICVRTGFHCAPFVHEFLGTETLGGTVRVSVGAFNTKKDIDTLINALKTL